MKILVIFKSGVRQNFIVPVDINYVDFMPMATAIGGKIYRLEFL